MKQQKQTPHGRHEKLAVFAFLFTLLLAIGAFYYIWQNQSPYGKTLEGLQLYWEAEWKRTHPGEPLPVVVFEQPEKVPCCCKTKGGFANDIWAVVPKGSSEEVQLAECIGTCEEKFHAQGMGLGRCGKYGLSYPG